MGKRRNGDGATFAAPASCTTNTRTSSIMRSSTSSSTSARKNQQFQTFTSSSILASSLLLLLMLLHQGSSSSDHLSLWRTGRSGDDALATSRLNINKRLFFTSGARRRSSSSISFSDYQEEGGGEGEEEEGHQQLQRQLDTLEELETTSADMCSHDNYNKNIGGENYGISISKAGISRPRRIFNLNANINSDESINTANNNDIMSLEQQMQQRRQFNSQSAVSMTNEKSNTSNNINIKINGHAHDSQSPWPPWPFNLLKKPQNRNSNSNNDSTQTRFKNSSNNNLSGAQLLTSYLRLKAKGGFEQMQQVGTALSFHLPPAAPPLILLAILPTAAHSTKLLNVVEKSASSVNANINAIASSSGATTFMPNLSILSKQLALSSLSIAVLSWADCEVRKKKRLTPLPLSRQYRDIRKTILPPFLPEQLPPLSLDPLLKESSSSSSSTSSMEPRQKLANVLSDAAIQSNVKSFKSQKTGRSIDTNTSTSDKIDENDSDEIMIQNLDNLDNLKRSIHKLYEKAPKPQRLQVILQSWKKMNHIRQREEMDMKRQKIVEELLLLKEIKRRQQEMKMRDKERFSVKKATGLMYHKGKDLLQGNSTSTGVSTSSAGGTSGNMGMGRQYEAQGQRQRQEPPLGYALVTGASRGIGRAIAVELARWDIPLILVARDTEKLTAVASEIEMAYGVNCCVIPADLSRPEVAKQIFQATEDAGLRVDILVNNAGVCTTGDLIDENEDDIANMINVNVGSVTNLSYLFGKRMKRRRRGRILFVSSVVGATPGGPGVAAYSATKAYEKSLAQSMGRELEKYGVGVTCIMPGAVKGTSFAARSNAEEALCWKFPFYPMKAPNVAARGVRALLTGDAEVIPGWHNRLFLKVLSPLLPQRLITSVVGFSFTPLQIGTPSWPWMTVSSESEESLRSSRLVDSISRKRPPMILKLPRYDAAPQEPKISMESTPEVDNLGSNAESSEDSGTEKNELAETAVDEHSKNSDANVDAEYAEDMIGLLSH